MFIDRLWPIFHRSTEYMFFKRIFIEQWTMKILKYVETMKEEQLNFLISFYNNWKI